MDEERKRPLLFICMPSSPPDDNLNQNPIFSSSFQKNVKTPHTPNNPTGQSSKKKEKNTPSSGTSQTFLVFAHYLPSSPQYLLRTTDPPSSPRGFSSFFSSLFGKTDKARQDASLGIDRLIDRKPGSCSLCARSVYFRFH